MNSSTALLTLVLSLSLVSCAMCHGVMAIPNQRGTLDREKFNMNAPEIDSNAETDFKPHFPAGNKCDTPGCGKLSQERSAGPAGWIPFEPLSQNYKWHAGVCGDEVGGGEHLRGGKYYNGGQITATYKQGGKIAITLNIVAHHNGFNEFHVCDIAKCDGEISQKCFREGHCKQLQRSRNPSCDSGMSKACAPIDPNYPGRWYYPCSKFGLSAGTETYGAGGEILYDLPENLSCEHCVIQWYWATANGCNPPGVIDFFDSPNAPKTWGQCPGSGGARGGVAREQRQCGRHDGELRTPEEYLQCSDIRIESSQGRSGAAPSQGDTPAEPDAPSPEIPTTTPIVTPPPSMSPNPEPVAAGDGMPTESPAYSMEASPEVSAEPQSSTGGRSEDAMVSRSGLIADIVLYADGEVVRSINDGDEIDISGYEGFTIQAITTREVRKVEFFIDGKHIKDEGVEPYFLSGNRGTDVSYWKDPIVNREFTLVTKAEDSMDKVTIKLINGA